jgi:D-xylose 1-dehydrogenase (NADP+, D-xylono-1,5-lactone-forming)
MADRLRWGVLGAAYIALAKVIPAIQASSNGVVVSLASRDRARAQALAAEVGVERVHASYDALLADPDVDAIYNPLPNSMHAEWSIRAAAAGKAVLCEKPLALSAAEAERVVAAFAQRGVLLMEGFMYRFHPQHVRVRALLAEGAIGEVGEVRAGLCARLLDPADPGNVRLQPDLGGGARLDMGCYVVNAARMLFGQEPRRVLAWQDVDERFGVDMALAGILEYPGERIATVSCSFKAGYESFYAVVGSRGVIEVPRAFIPGYGDRAAETLVVISDENSNRHEEHFPPTDHYRLMVEAFGAAVLAGQPVPYPPEDSVRNMRVLDALRTSADQNRPVLIDP